MNKILSILCSILLSFSLSLSLSNSFGKVLNNNTPSKTEISTLDDELIDGKH